VTSGRRRAREKDGTMKRFLLLVTVLIPFASGCESQGAKPAAATGTPASASLGAAPAPAPGTGARNADVVYAYVDSVRGDLSDGKARLINKVMALSSDESSKFWPIYHDYEQEFFAIGDRRVEITRAYVNAQASGSLDNARAAALSDDWFRFESQRLELLRKYNKRISDELSPIRAAQFTQIENRVGTVVDLLLASELPLVRKTAP
jgi:hypothetical protein